MGLVESASKVLNTFCAIWQWAGLLPEELDYSKLFTGKIEANFMYPLRPELIESTYYQYRSTGDNTWLSASIMFLNSIQNTMKGKCGYAAVQLENGTKELMDTMPSFFLSETLKYLYLTFDSDNFINSRPYIFSTEAHPFDTVQLQFIAASQNHSHFGEKSWDGSNGIDDMKKGEEVESNKLLKKSILSSKRKKNRDPRTNIRSLLPRSCRKRQWDEYYSGYSSFNTNYQLELSNDAALRQHSELNENWIQNFPGFVAKFHVPTATTLMNGLTEASKKVTKGKRRADVCYDDNNAARAIHQPSPSASIQSRSGFNGGSNRFSENEESVQGATPKGGQMISIDLGELGMFKIEMFSDAFTITSINDGNKVEVSNLGKRGILVSDSGGKGSLASIPSSTLASSVDGTTMTCHVSISLPPEISSLYKLTHDDNKVFEYKDCSISAFGPTLHMSHDFITVQMPTMTTSSDDEAMTDDQIEPLEARLPTDGIEVSGPISVASDEHRTGCGDVQNDKNNAVEENIIKGTLQWVTGKFFKGKKEEDIGVKKDGEEKDRVVFIDRGDCVFEKKVEIAQSKGAIGAVVVNHDSNIFLMSGSTVTDVIKDLNGNIIKDLNSIDDDDDDNGQSSEEDIKGTSGIIIPSVMISKDDNISLMESYEYISNRFAISPDIKIEISKDSNFVNSIHMGNNDYPKVYASPQYISIASRGSWSAVLTAGNKIYTTENGKENMMEWKLLILDKLKESFSAKSTWTMKTSLGSKVTVQQQVSHDGIIIYKRLLQRKCTDCIDVDGGDSSFLLRR